MNLFFSSIPASLTQEVSEILVQASSVRIGRIISHGQASPEGFWFDQDEHEWVLVVQGAARVRFEEEVRELRPGDWINIPAHQKHRVDWTTPDEPTIWVAVYYY